MAHIASTFALLRRSDLGHQLLGQDVERGDGRLQQIEPALPYGGEERRALHELVARGRVEPARRRAVSVVVGPADPLQEGADGPGRPDLAHQFDRADVDAELERGRGHQRTQVAGAEARLDDAQAPRADRLPWCAATSNEASTSFPSADSFSPSRSAN